MLMTVGLAQNDVGGTAHTTPHIPGDTSSCRVVKKIQSTMSPRPQQSDDTKPAGIVFMEVQVTLGVGRKP